VSREAGLHFWLSYVEREGALIEDAGDSALVVLTPRLREDLDLPETVTVSSDPDVAREDGALLLIAGHPALDAAAARVLAEGDVGTSHLEWPRKAPPGRDLLVARARDELGVEHGRIDPGGEPIARYAPVLRVGVQVTYRVDDHFHEREEAWVDARTGLVPSPDLTRQLDVLPRLTASRPEHVALEPDLPMAVGAAHRLLEARATARRGALARQSEPAVRDELTQAEVFYDAALESLAQRRAAAEPRRQSLFDAQVEATRAERARRLQEIREKFAARHEIRPVRLHLFMVPALYLPVMVRRGARTFPFALTWWLPTADFATVRCPGCGEAAPLVAGKNRLGCRACLGLPAATPPMPESEPPEDMAPKPAATNAQRHAPSLGAIRGGGSPGRPASGTSLQPAADPTAAEAEWRRNYQQFRGRVVRVGNKLGGDFWRAVADGASWPRKRADPHSPLSVLYRLYGADGPLRGIGIPPGMLPTESSCITADPDPDPDLLHCTGGRVVAGGAAYRYLLAWRLEAGRPAVHEVGPFPRGRHVELPARWLLPPGVGMALHQGAPSPRIDLDPVANALWQSELPQNGLTLVARCLAAWWRVADDPGLPAQPPQALAAAIAAMVGRRAGLNRTREAAAADYGIDRSEVVAAARRLQALLGLSDTRCW